VPELRQEVASPQATHVSHLFALDASDVADTTNDHYTPPWVFDAAGLVFDMDVAAPVDPSRRTCPARRYLTPVEDGLTQPWEGVVWMNSPWRGAEPWAERFAEHGCGVALAPMWGRCTWRARLLGCADAVAVIWVDFTRPDGSKLMTIAPSALVGCGRVAVGAVARVAAADRYAGGTYHVRP
jgi:hypothetical protein